MTSDKNELLIPRTTLQDSLKRAKYNPALMMKYSMDLLQQTTNGKLDFVDASNPAVMLLEMSAVMAANNLAHFSKSDGQHYPVLATHMTDLYHHMSDELFDARFATPAVARFLIAFDIGQLKLHAEPTEINGVSQVVIPRYSVITIDSVEFTLLYPVVIRVLQNKSMHVLYDTREISDIETLESNIVEYYYYSGKKTDYDNELLMIDLPLLQLSRKEVNHGVTYPGNPFNKDIGYTHDFVKVNVYLLDDVGNKRKIKVTHSDLVYDPMVITARCKILDNQTMRINIPMIYYDTGRIKEDSVIVETYTTHGGKQYDLMSMESSSGVSFRIGIPENPEDTKYTKMLETIQPIISARNNTSGGRAAATFDEMKRWVIEGGQVKRTPITTANIKLNAEHMGYDLTTDLDQVTNRVFQAKREILSDGSGEFTRGAGCSVESLVLVVKDILNHPDVNVHNGRYTLLPSALFRTANGKTTLLNKQDIPDRSQMTLDKYISEINTLEYIFTPFYYCLDATGKQFSMRAYHMDNPEIISQRFIEANHGIQSYVAVDTPYQIERTEKGYRIVITTRSDDTYKEIPYDDLFVQMAFIPRGEADYAYINGEFLGISNKNLLWGFDIDTTFDFDHKDHLIMNNFKILTREQRYLACPLKAEMHLIFGMYDVDVGQSGENNKINNRVGVHLLARNRRWTVIAENSITVKFGHALTNLWRNTRTLASLNEYQRYEVNVPLTYADDVPELDENQLPRYTTADDGSFEFVLKHRQGDQILDAAGQPIYKHRIGDIMLDEESNPIVVQSKSTLRVLDIFFIDGIYRFANAKEDLEYIKSIPNQLVNWLENDIRRMKMNLMENTHLYFMPKRTMGYINILAEAGIEKRIFNRLPFEITFYLTDRAFNNEDIKESIRRQTSVIINNALREKTISRDIIENRLREAGGKEYIQGVNIKDMGLGADINTFTMLDDGDNCSVRRKIVSQSDGTIKVKEEINIQFINHTPKLK